jgi:hypothetical protein
VFVALSLMADKSNARTGARSGASPASSPKSSALASKLRTSKNQKGIVIEIAALAGKGYPAATNLDSGSGQGRR